MFSAKFISVRDGVSKNGNRYFQIELIADTLDGGAKVVSTFCSESAFNNCQGFKPMQDVKVACGVNANGYITINAVKGV